MDDILYFDSMIHSSLSTFFFSSGVKDFRSGNPEQRMEKVFFFLVEIKSHINI
jgi:hypothetical protein